MPRILWTCPFCDRGASIGDSDTSTFAGQLKINTVHGFRHLAGQYIVCPNPKCREFTLQVALCEFEFEAGSWEIGDVLRSWNLVPPSKAKPFPQYIPEQILKDYQEACLIVSASPKASATLSRRCLQGMIRNFWQISKSTLKAEIDELESHVDNETWKAIDAIRKVGNIGAHMERDVNLIVDVETEEAEKLIWLIELLLKEWYVAKHDREEKLKEIDQMAAEKDEAKKSVSAKKKETAGLGE